MFLPVPESAAGSLAQVVAALALPALNVLAAV